MDRNLIVRQGDILFAEVSYNYLSQVAGAALITIYGSLPLEHGLSSSVPLITYTTEFSHPLLSTFAEIEAFDHDLLKVQPAPPRPEGQPDIVIIEYDNTMSLEYPAVHYRYVLNNPFSGIADIYVNMHKNTKELKFTSGRSISSDSSSSTIVFETNLNFCIGFSNTHIVDAPTEFLRLW